MWNDLIKYMTAGHTVEITNLLKTVSDYELNTKVDDRGRTALHLAIPMRAIKAIGVLILRMDSKAMNTRDVGGTTPLILSIAVGLENIAELLLGITWESNINTDAYAGYTPLSLAAASGREKIFKLLLPKTNEKFIKVVDPKYGNTVLHQVVINCYVEVVESLLSRLSYEDINIINNARKTALDIAMEYSVLNVGSKRQSYDKIVRLINSVYEKQKAELEAKQQAELLAKQKAEEIIMKSKQPIIQEIFKLTAEGDARIKEENEKGILILGKTGAGKSTLACLLANEELEAFEDNKDKLRLKTASSYDGNIKIGHTTVSETKIPNKYKLEDVTIWDCPGFMDTRSTAQEMANADALSIITTCPLFNSFIKNCLPKLQIIQCYMSR